MNVNDWLWTTIWVIILFLNTGLAIWWLLYKKPILMTCTIGDGESSITIVVEATEASDAATALSLGLSMVKRSKGPVQ